jgi:hypothetical protein
MFNYSTPWNDALDKILLNYRNQGLTSLEMSKRIGKTESQVKNRLKRLNVKTKNSYFHGLKF